VTSHPSGAERAQRTATSRRIDFRYAPPDGWTLICRPDDPHKSLVREDGALLYGFDGRTVDVCQFHSVIELSAGGAHRPVSVEQETELAHRAIVRTTVRYPDQTLELVAFGHRHDGRRTDVVLWRITAAEHAREVLASLHVEAYIRGRALAAPAGSEAPHELFAVPLDAPVALPPEGTDGVPRLTAASGRPAGCTLRSVPQPLIETHAAGFRPAAGAVTTTPEILGPGGSTGGAIIVPLDHAETAALDVDWARDALDRERGFWDGLDLTPRVIAVPDPDLQDLIVACSRNILQAREIEDGLPVMHVGPTIYRGLWLVDGHFLMEAARYLGFDDAADAGLQALLCRVRPDGSIAQMDHVPHIKETGIAIATIVRQSELSGDLERLRELWPVVRAAVGHIEDLRRRARDLPADHPLHALTPEGFGDGGVAGGARAELTTALWTLAGLRESVRGARLLGRPEDEARFSAAYESLRRDFDRAAAAQRRRLPAGEGHYLPMSLPLSGRHQFLVGADAGDPPRWREIQPETATWALCHAIWPGEVFEPDDLIVRDLLALYDARDDEEGLPATTGFLSFRAVWSYGASFAAHAWLYAGRPDKALDYLYAFANHAFPTRVWREEQSLARSGNRQVVGDMPHNWASAELIRLVRHLLVFERGADLELLAGVSCDWVAPGATIALERTPTRFGPVSLTTEATDEALTVTVVRHAGGFATPRELRLVAPPGFGGPVLVDGTVASPREDGHLLLVAEPEVEVTVELRR
jgi:hypothetical protein